MALPHIDFYDRPNMPDDPTDIRLSRVIRAHPHSWTQYRAWITQTAPRAAREICAYLNQHPDAGPTFKVQHEGPPLPIGHHARVIEGKLRKMGFNEGFSYSAGLRFLFREIQHGKTGRAVKLVTGKKWHDQVLVQQSPYNPEQSFQELGPDCAKYRFARIQISPQITG